MCSVRFAQPGLLVIAALLLPLPLAGQRTAELQARADSLLHEWRQANVLAAVQDSLRAAASVAGRDTIRVGALMILAGGLWFFFFLRVNVAHDGASGADACLAPEDLGEQLASAVNHRRVLVEVRRAAHHAEHLAGFGFDGHKDRIRNPPLGKIAGNLLLKPRIEIIDDRTAVA